MQFEGAGWGWCSCPLAAAPPHHPHHEGQASFLCWHLPSGPHGPALAGLPGAVGTPAARVGMAGVQSQGCPRRPSCLQGIQM